MAAKLPDLTNQKVGEYEVIKPIGVGGMGAVYEGRQPMIGKRVAIKVLLPQLSSEPELVERFLSEAKAVNAIRHRAIVDIFSFGTLPDGSNYFVMEFLEGKALDRVIRDRAPLPVGETLVWMDEVLEALDAAHHAGVIHRDIKPSNLFLVEGSRGRQYIKLLDFGIAKLSPNVKGDSTPQTRASMVIGTPDYMSPEQARGRQITPATDLYALGCVMFELLTGRRPFEGENPMATMFMHVEEEPKAPSVFNPQVPRTVDELVLWMLQKAPSARPGSAEECRLHVHAMAGELAGAETGPLARLGGSRTPSPRTPLPSLSSRSSATPSAGSASGRSSRSGIGARSKATGPNAGATLEDSDDDQVGFEKTKMRSQLTPQPQPTSSQRKQAPPPEPEPEVADVPGPRDEAEEPIKVPGRSPVPFVIGGALVLGLGIGAFAMFRSKDPGPTGMQVAPPPEERVAVPETPKPVIPPPEPVAPPPEPKPTVAEVKPPEPAPPVEPKPAPEAKPVVDAKPVEPKPVVAAPKPPVTGDAKPVGDGGLGAKIVALRKKLEEKEAMNGRPDPLARRVLDQAAEKVKSAKTDAQRKEAREFVNDATDMIGH